jgi:hypothetical protein
MPAPKPVTEPAEKHERAQHIFASMLNGRALSEIARDEALSVRRVQQIVADEIARRNTNPARDYVLLQIARLETALDMLGRQIENGKASAVPGFLKVIEQLGLLTKRELHRDTQRFRPGLEDKEMRERLEQLDVSREVVTERRSRTGLNEGAKSHGPQALDIPQNREIADFAAP